MPSPPREYLQRIYVQNAKFANEANMRANEVSREVAQEKTQSFEKIALAAGGTLALVVSFVGAHAGKLQPPWLLRTSLVALVLTMIAAMARNWRYPFYLTGLHGRKYAEVMLDRERAIDYGIALPTMDPDTIAAKRSARSKRSSSRMKVRSKKRSPSVRRKRNPRSGKPNGWKTARSY